ncbi:MAG: hypothetical protein CMJ40_07135 [Phycisphaerae bacterium]|nr:hypothetical protein [Phycisphaerae bacterium]|tara:strand:- start:303 stop:1778 length:1476 start_codon:yes stop_codon:yes gene_type:complete
MNFHFGLAVFSLAFMAAIGSMVPLLDSTVQAAPGAYPPYFQKLERGLFYPAYLQRDAALITEQLGLSDQERVLVEFVINSYVETFEQEAEAVRIQMEALESPDMLELPDHVNRKDIRRRAKAEMTSDRSGGGINGQIMEKLSVRRARATKIISEELELEPLGDLNDSARTQLIVDWGIRRAELERGLLEQLELIRSENGDHWDAIRRALRRLNSDWTEEFRGEETDLELLMREHFGQDDPNYLKARRLLSEYAIDYDMQLAIRNAVLSETTPLLLDALDRTHLQQALAISRDQITARANLVDLNMAWRQRLLDSIEDERRRADFEHYMNARMYPNLHLGDPPAATIDYLINARLVDPETEATLLAIKDEYKSERDAWRMVAIMLKPEWERDRLMQELESNVVGMAYKGWLNGLGNRRESLIGWKNHLASGRQIDQDYFNKIQSIIGFEAMNSVPGRFRVSRRGDGSRGPVPRAARSANVVYWNGFMNEAMR